MALTARVCQAVSQPDISKTLFRVVKDAKEECRVHGAWASIDRTDPPNGFTPQIITVNGTYWQFKIGESITDWCIGSCTTNNGADACKVQIEGTHIHGPHEPPGPPVDAANNALPLVTSFQPVSIKWKAAPVAITAQSKVKHLAPPGVPHYDLYGVRHVAAALQGPPNMLAGAVEIDGRHTTDDEKYDHVDFGICFGGTPGDGSSASYNVVSQTLTLHMGAISFLNGEGVFAAGVEPKYLGDPILNAHLGDMTLHYMGPTGDGGYRFGGGHASLLDPEGDLAFEGSFSEYLIYDTSRIGVINSGAFFDSLGIADVGECRSALLNDFSEINVLGETLSSTEWLDVVGTGLSFVTSQNLAALTAGFTQSAFGVPATVGICALKRIPVVGGVRPSSEMDVSVVRASPNPFRDQTTIHYRLAETGKVRVEIFDPSGRLVRRLMNENSQPAGDYAATWDGTTAGGKKLPAGLYLYRVSLGSRTWTNGMVLLK